MSEQPITESTPAADQAAPQSPAPGVVSDGGQPGDVLDQTSPVVEAAPADVSGAGQAPGAGSTDTPAAPEVTVTGVLRSIVDKVFEGDELAAMHGQLDQL